MRQLLCETCAQQYLPTGTRKILEQSEEGEPAEFQRLVLGVARHPNPLTHVITVNDEAFPLDPNFYICDECNAAVRPGDRCAALSVWSQWQRPVGKWEDEVLETSKDV